LPITSDDPILNFEKTSVIDQIAVSIFTPSQDYSNASIKVIRQAGNPLNLPFYRNFKFPLRKEGVGDLS
jgi:hypothetical protein